MDGEPRVRGSLHNVNVKENVNARFDIGQQTTRTCADRVGICQMLESLSGMSMMIHNQIFTMMPATFDFR